MQYAIDREGKITRLLPEGAKGYHAGRLEKMPGWGNENLEGVEVIAKDEKDVTDVQRQAVARLAAQRGKRWGYDLKTRIFGHGEGTGRKERDEGATAKMIRKGKIALPNEARAELRD